MRRLKADDLRADDYRPFLLFPGEKKTKKKSLIRRSKAVNPADSVAEVNSWTDDYLSGSRGGTFFRRRRLTSCSRSRKTKRKRKLPHRNQRKFDIPADQKASITQGVPWFSPRRVLISIGMFQDDPLQGQSNEYGHSAAAELSEQTMRQLLTSPPRPLMEHTEVLVPWKLVGY